MIRVKELIDLFQNELQDIYPKQEISAIFFQLTEHYNNSKRIDLSLNPDLSVNQEKYLSALNELKKHKPLQYIIGKKEFYGLSFLVNNKVLIPRPETEDLVDWIIADNKHKSNLSILDIGTGSGAIAIALAKHLPDAKITALDISEQALEVAQKNAEQHKVSIDFKQIDILKQDQCQQHFDIIVSNPPYVREQEKKLMRKNVLDYEPHTALFVSDNNPLLFYEKIIDVFLKKNTTNDLLYFEINEFLKNDLITLLKKKNLLNFHFKNDFFGSNRMLKICQ
jgi:release factor glutamine methyltransferase